MLGISVHCIPILPNHAVMATLHFEIDAVGVFFDGVENRNDAQLDLVMLLLHVFGQSFNVLSHFL